MITNLYKQKTSLELSWQQEHNLHGKYTLDMVRIDSKIREVINEIKLEEARIATKENAIANSLSAIDRFICYNITHELNILSLILGSEDRKS